MSKYLKVLLLTMLAVGLISGSAFAAAALNAGNTTVAAEKISASAVYAGAAANTAYQVGGPIGATTVLKLTIGNGSFGANAAGAIKMCDGAVQVDDTATPATVAGDTTVNITLGAPLASGTVYTFTNAGVCAIAATFTGIRINAGSTDGTTVTLSVDSVTVPGDPNVVASAIIYTVKNQFSATLSPVTSRLDFATNMKTFVVADTGPLPHTPTLTDSQAALILASDESINDKIAVTTVGACTNTLPAGDSINVKITGDLTGITAIQYNDAGGYTITDTDRTNGFATLNIIGTSMQICKSTDTPSNTAKALELTAVGTSGTSPIATGTRTAQISLVAAVDFANARDLIAAGTTSHIIQLNATQFYVPLVGSNLTAGRETYIKLQSKSTYTGANGVFVTVLKGDGTTVIYTPNEANGDIGCGSGTMTAGTPCVILGENLLNAAGITGDSTAAIVNLNAPEADAFCYANMIDPSGAKRLPCKVVGGMIVE